MTGTRRNMSVYNCFSILGILSIRVSLGSSLGLWPLRVVEFRGVSSSDRPEIWSYLLALRSDIEHKSITCPWMDKHNYGISYLQCNFYWYKCDKIGIKLIMTLQVDIYSLQLDWSIELCQSYYQTVSLNSSIRWSDVK